LSFDAPAVNGGYPLQRDPRVHEQFFYSDPIKRASDKRLIDIAAGGEVSGGAIFFH
jgi:hypothetical protein